MSQGNRSKAVTDGDRNMSANRLIGAAARLAITPVGAGPERVVMARAVAARGVMICGMATGDHLTELLAAAEEEFAEAGFRTGDFARVRELLAEALAGAEQAGDLAGRARALDLLGMVAHYDNLAKLMSGHRVPAHEIDAEERLFRQALAAWHAAGQRAATAQALFGLGLVYQVLHSDWTSAMPYFWQAFELVDADDADTGLYLRSEVHRHVGFYFLVSDEQPAEGGPAFAALARPPRATR